MVLFSACLGKPRVHAKGRSEHQKINSDTMNASWKYRITLRRWIFRYGRDLWLHRCRQHCAWTPVTKRIWNYSKKSEFENINGLFGITRMMIEGNSEIKNVFPADVASSQGENWCCKKNKQSSGQKQECTSSRTPYYAWENSTVQKMQLEGGMIIKCQLWRCILPSENCKG